MLSVKDEITLYEDDFTNISRNVQDCRLKITVVLKEVVNIKFGCRITEYIVYRMLMYCRKLLRIK